MLLPESGSAGRWGENGESMCEGTVINLYGWRVGDTMEERSTLRENLERFVWTNPWDLKYW